MKVGSTGLEPAYPRTVASKEPSQIDGVMFAGKIVPRFGVQESTAHWIHRNKDAN
jgi:hypothetical protein